MSLAAAQAEVERARERRRAAVEVLTAGSEARRQLRDADAEVAAGLAKIAEAEARVARELSEAEAEHADAKGELLELLPRFVDAIERAQAARVRLDAKARAAGALPRPRMEVTGELDRGLLRRWRRAVAVGFRV